mmetsp:Transcript_21687/g.32976  ORF Transcript_21687/g.32976 Transcript_21687/m.32976 type:complete len:206 (-) Transcript_21687:322-939(-)
MSFLDEYNRDRHEESKEGGKSKLISNTSDSIPHSLSLHELLVLVTLKGGEHVRNTGGYKSRNSKVKLLHRSKDNSSNDNGKTRPLGLGNGLVVNKLGKNGGESGLGSLYNLSKGNGSGGKGEYRGRMGTHEAEGNGEHLNDIIHGDLRSGTGIGGNPHEQGVDASNSELKRRNGHGETGRSTSGTESELVGDVVVVVSNVPEKEV